MDRYKRFFCTSFLVFTLMTTSAYSARAETLRIVFESSLWGSGIGAVSGLALWALQDEDKEDKIFSKYMIKGAALGVFLGMAVGIYDSQSGGDVFMSEHQPKGLLHLDSDDYILSISPAKILPQPVRNAEEKTDWQMSLFTATF